MTLLQEKSMYRGYTSKNKTICIASNVLTEIEPVCDGCDANEALSLQGTIRGTNERATFRILSDGFEYEGNTELLERVMKARCLKCSL